MNLYKKEIHFLLTCPSVLPGLIFFAVAPAFYFFVIGNFFDGGTANLIKIFEFLPFCATFFVPAVTMNSWSAEFSHGKLNGFGEFLFSRPFPLQKIFLAKWLAAFTVFLGGILTLIPTIIASSSFIHVDPGICLSSFILLIFFFAAVTSLGIFLSFRVKNPIFAFGIYALLLIISAILPDFCKNSHFLREYASFLGYFSFSAHFQSASLGIFDSRDLIFYLVVAVFFFFACFPGKKSTFGLFSLLCSLILLNAHFYPANADVSANKIFSLSKTTEKIFGDAKSRVEITYFRSSKLKNHYPQTPLVEIFLQKYRDLGAVVKIVDPVKENLLSHLNDLGIFPQQIQSATRGETTFSDVFSGILIESEGHHSVIPFVVSSENLEFEIANRMLNILGGKKPQVQVISANHLTLADAYVIGMQFLALEEFELIQLFPGELSDLDTNAPLLVFGGSSLSESDVMAISEFCENGGNALFCVGSSRVDVSEDWTCTAAGDEKRPLLRLFESWGVQITDDLVLDVSCANIVLEETDTGGNSSGRLQHLNYPFWVQPLPKSNQQKKFCSLWPNEILIFPTDDTEISPLFTSSAASWLQNPNSDGTYKVDPFGNYSGENNPQSVGEHTIACILQKNGSKRIFFADELSFSQMTHYSQSYENFEVMLDCVLVLCQRDELLSMRKASSLATPVFEEEDFGAKKLSAYGLVFILVPMLIVVFFVIFGRIRRGKL